jgi:hypothetical protein
MQNLSKTISVSEMTTKERKFGKALFGAANDTALDVCRALGLKIDCPAIEVASHPAAFAFFQAAIGDLIATVARNEGIEVGRLTAAFGAATAGAI